jgi:hypothetical protein
MPGEVSPPIVPIIVHGLAVEGFVATMTRLPHPNDCPICARFDEEDVHG